MTAASDTRAVYVDGFEGFARERAASDPRWLAKLRADAIGSFAEIGFPTPRLEEWRYTNVTPIVREPFDLAGVSAVVSSEAIAAKALPGLSPAAVFVDGLRRSELESPAKEDAAAVLSLAALRGEDDSRLSGVLGALAEIKGQAFAALNTAYLDDGAVVALPPGQSGGAPMTAMFVSAGEDRRLCHPRVLARAGSESSGCIVLDFSSLADGVQLCNAVTEIHVGPNASLSVVVVQREGAGAVHVGSVHARLERDARLDLHTLTLGGAFVRNDLRVELAGEGAEATLNGLYLGVGEQLVDNHTLVDHATPHGTSRELYKGVLGGRSRGVFRGRVVVRPGAQKTDATQSNRNLLTSDAAEVDSKPQLEIYADDVKCSHGSTIGQLDPDALFYLRARGIDPETAAEILGEGFAGEVLDALPVPELADALRDRVRQRIRTQAATAVRHRSRDAR